MAQITPDPIMRIALGFMAAKHLFVANEIGLFAGLAQGPAPLHELAAICGIPRRTVGISADAMVSLGLLERNSDRYRNSDTAAAFLAGQPGPDLRPMLRFWNRISYPGWLALEDAVRAGAGQAKFGEFSDQEQQIFSAGVETFSAATAASLAANYDFSRHRRLLDIGGGTGSFLLPILRRHPTLRGTLFELPGACEAARRRLAGEPEGPGSTWSRETSSVTRCLPNTMFCCSPIRSMCSPPCTISTCYASCVSRRRQARTCCFSICGWIRAIRSLRPRPSCQASS